MSFDLEAMLSSYPVALEFVVQGPGKSQTPAANSTGQDALVKHVLVGWAAHWSKALKPLQYAYAQLDDGQVANT
jgi:hypothetical protein